MPPLTQARSPLTKRMRRGFVMIQLGAVLIILTLMLTFLGRYLIQKINESAAESSAKQMLIVRDSLVQLQIEYEAFLRDKPDSSPPVDDSSVWSWSPAPGSVGGQIMKGEIVHLKDAGLMDEKISDYMPLGERPLWLLHRTGSCLSNTCRIAAYVYSCRPLTAHRTSGSNTTSCDSMPLDRSHGDVSLIGQFIVESEGYGGTDVLDDTYFQGALFGESAPRDLFGFSEGQGRVAIMSGLNSTPFNQFVRMGDDRPVHLQGPVLLQDSLVVNGDVTVGGELSVEKGIIITQKVNEGDSCEPDGMFGSTHSNGLATCVGGQWFNLTGYMVTSVSSGLTNGQTAPIINCPAPMVAWRQVALAGVDILSTNISVEGGITGNVAVNLTGEVSEAGVISIVDDLGLTGSFDTASGSIEVGQRASIDESTGVITITGARPGSVATLMQGCRMP